MKTDKPLSNIGKTYFNKIKAKGESWTVLRYKAIKDGTWRPAQRITPINPKHKTHESTAENDSGVVNKTEPKTE